MLKVGIIGVGTVGQSVAQILEDNADIITARAGQEIKAVKGVVSNLAKKRDVSITLSDDVNTILDDEDIDIVVELMGGIEGPLEVVKKALLNGKAVVTANKALLAYHRYELQDLAGDLAFEYEAGIGDVEESIASSVFPNPANESLSFVFDEEVEAELRIFNNNGQLVQQITVSGKELHTDVSDLTAGNYYYGLFDKNRKIGSGQFVISR